jgi:4-amino-4-deoxy-L-arabinose transferase-like glycosyltransferase
MNRTARNVPTEGLVVRVFLLPFFLTVAFLFLFRLDDRDLWASHEARAAQNAQRFLDDGDWLTPRLFDDQVELQKPPLYYWLVAFAGKMCGGEVGPMAVRLPAALAGFATVVVVFAFLAGSGRPLAGLLAAFVLATAQHFTWIARTGRIDVPLTFTVTCAVLCLWQASRPGVTGGYARWFEVAGYLAMAAGILLKGPLGAMLPMIVLVATAAVVGRPLVPRSALWGVPLVCAVAAPWFVIAHLRTHGDFTRVFFWHHNIQRATGGSLALAKHPWWFYGPRFFFDFLPWSPLLLIGAFHCRSEVKRETDRGEGRLGITWFLAVLVLLSLSRFKRADYLLPAFPGAAIWLGCVSERMYARWRSPTLARCLAVGIAGAIACVLIGWSTFLRFAVPKWNAAHGERAFAAAIREVVPPPEQVLLFRVENHLLAYHLGRPLNTFLEWENLDVWAGRTGPHFIVMPAECAAQWAQYITSGSLAEELRYTDRTDRDRPRDLVLMRTTPGKRDDATTAGPPEGEQRADQRSASRAQPGDGPGGNRRELAASPSAGAAGERVTNRRRRQY